MRVATRVIHVTFGLPERFDNCLGMNIVFRPFQLC